MSQETELLINSIILPQDIFFEQGQTHYMHSTAEDTPAIIMRSSDGFYIRDTASYNSGGEYTEEPVVCNIDSDGNFVPFNILEGGQRLYVLKGSRLTFEWETKPSVEVVKTMTLVAKKKVEADSDTAVVRLSGYFLVHDSIKGWVRNSLLAGDEDSLRMILSLSQFALYSDGTRFEDAFLSNFFYDDFSAVATGYDPVFYQHGTLTIKNMSAFPRVVTLVPYNLGVISSSIDEDLTNLPDNVEVRNGSLILTLAANQDT